MTGVGGLLPLQGSRLNGCVMGNNSYVGAGCSLEASLVLGNDYYTNDKTRAQSLEKGESALGIGARASSHACVRACMHAGLAVCAGHCRPLVRRCR